MKKKMTMKIGALGAMALMLLVAFAGANTVGCGPPCDPTPCDPYKDVLLKAGQNIDVGWVQVWHDGDNLYVKYMLDDDDGDCGWYITESHLSVVVGDWEVHPQKKNLKIGHFEFTDPDDEGPKYHLYEIPWSEIEDADGVDFVWGDTLDIVAHAVVMKVCDGETVQGETAYGDGDEHWKNWAMSFSYTPCDYKTPDFPAEIDYQMWRRGSNSYWDTDIYVDGDAYYPPEAWNRDDWWVWCIDRDGTTGNGASLSAVLSIPDPETDWVKFCKWNKVNYVLNNDNGLSWQVTQAVIWNIWLETTIQQNMGFQVTLTAEEVTVAEDLAEEASTKCCYRTWNWVGVILTPTTNNQICLIEWDP